MVGRLTLTLRLNRLINLSLIMALLATTGGLALLVRQAYQASADTRRTLAQLPIYRQALLTVEAIVRERGPTNAMLGGRGGDPITLGAARALSDERFAALQEALTHCVDCQITPTLAATAYDQLRKARGAVDALLHQPGSRSGEAVNQAVEGMLRASEHNFVSVDLLMHGIIQRTPGIATCLVNSMLSARLRDVAGSLGSLLTPALTEGRTLTDEEREAVHYTRGRIAQMIDLLNGNMERFPGSPERASFDHVKQYYLSDDLAFYQQTLEDMAAGRAPSAAAFAQGYVPPMKSILELRDAALQLALEEAQRLAAVAQRHLLLILIAALGIVLSLGSGLLLLKRRIIAPLLAHAHRLIALTHPHVAAIPGASGGLRHLFAVFAQLERQLLQAHALREERTALIAELERRAGTDHLTGLPNRRAFEEHLERPPSGSGWPVILTFDVDHFKRINDTYGHAAGDTLLRELAQRCQRLMRDGDRIARIGGEEFAVLAHVSHLDDGLALAERLRGAIADEPFVLVDRPLTVTASFGVAVAHPGQVWQPDVLMAAADAALYRAKNAGRNRSETAESC